jgi:hypothetical protein
MVFEGWAENNIRGRRKAVDRILVFSDDIFLFSTTALRKISFNPPFTSEQKNPNPGPRRGFVVAIPFSTLDGSTQSNFRVFGVTADFASQLENQSAQEEKK